MLIARFSILPDIFLGEGREGTRVRWKPVRSARFCGRAEAGGTAVVPGLFFLVRKELLLETL